MTVSEAFAPVLHKTDGHCEVCSDIDKVHRYVRTSKNWRVKKALKNLLFVLTEVVGKAP